VDTLSGAKWFSNLDLNSGYRQVDLHTDDHEKTAFSEGQGLWHFKVMHSGLCNDPATFEGLMEAVLLGFTYDICLMYLDDVIIIGRIFQEHLLNLRKVYERFREARLKLYPENCQLLQKEVKYLVCVVLPERISTDPEILKALREWPTPKNKHEFRSFLGLCTYYRRFISGFANIAKQLTRLKEEKQDFQYTQEVEDAFQTLKGTLCAAPILA
jgi:hypothetical protein